MNPWEEYAQQPQGEEGPWNAYAPGSVEIPEKIINEMHPDIDFATRAVYKNFGADPEASFQYLQKKQPNLQWKKDKSGEVLAKRPDETEWRRLDPKGFDLQDITDIGYDVPAAVAQGAATAASGLAGGVAGGGVGAIPAAMAGSAASGAGLEAVRQGLGSLMGIEDNMSGQDIGIAGAAGAVSPLLFGTGAGAKEAIKMVGKAGAKDLLATQRGLLGRGYDAAAGYVGPKLGTLVSGENTKVINKAAEMVKSSAKGVDSELIAAGKNPEIRTLPLKEVAQEVPQKLKSVTTETGKRLEDLRGMIDNQPGLILTGEGAATKGTGSIPAADFLAPFQELAEKLSAGGARTEGQLKDLEALKKVIESEFKGLPENLTAAQVDTLRKRFKERAQQYGLNYGKTGQAVGGTEGASAIDAQIALAFEDSRRKMNESIIKKLEQMGPEYADEYAKLNDQYSQLKNLAKESNTKFKNAKSVSNFLQRAINDDIEAQNLIEIEQITGVKLSDLAARDQALKVFSDPSSAIRSLRGATATARTIPLAGLGAAAGGVAGASYGNASGEGTYMPTLIGGGIGGLLGAMSGSPAALRMYMQANRNLRDIPTQMPGYKYLPYLMMNPNLNDQGE